MMSTISHWSSQLEPSMCWSDLRLMPGQGDLLYCHRAVLASHSSLLYSILGDCGEEEVIIILPDFSRDEIETTLQFLYGKLPKLKNPRDTFQCLGVSESSMIREVVEVDIQYGTLIGEGRQEQVKECEGQLENRDDVMEMASLDETYQYQQHTKQCEEMIEEQNEVTEVIVEDDVTFLLQEEIGCSTAQEDLLMDTTEVLIQSEDTTEVLVQSEDTTEVLIHSEDITGVLVQSEDTTEVLMHSEEREDGNCNKMYVMPHSQDDFSIEHMCEVCNNDFFSNQALKDHMKKHPTCPVCYQKLLSYTGYEEHLANHPQCKSCYTKFDCDEELKQHMKVHVVIEEQDMIRETTVYQNPEVREAISSIQLESPVCESQLKMEIISANPDLEVEEVTSLNDLSEFPSLLAAQNIQLQCDYCDQCFPTEAHLSYRTKMMHITNTNAMQSPNTQYNSYSKSEERRNIQCNFCSQSFSSYKAMNAHTVLAHPPVMEIPLSGFDVGVKSLSEQVEVQEAVTEFPFFCVACNQLFDKVSALGRHIDKEHPVQFEDTVPYSCSLCTTTPFLQITTLERHMLLQHTDSVQHTYRCPRCGLNIKTGSLGLRRHLRRHNPNFKLFGCSHCQEGFFNVTTLTKHEKGCDGSQRSIASIVKKKQPVVSITLDPTASGLSLRCTKCDAIVTNHQFEEHVCHKLANKPISMKAGKPKFKCARCGDVFTRKEQIKKHLKKCRRKLEVENLTEIRPPSTRNRKKKEDNIYVPDPGLSDNEIEDLIDSEDEFKLEKDAQEESDEGEMFVDGEDIINIEKKVPANTEDVISTEILSCTYCQRTFTTFGKLKKHESVHTGIYSYYCECGKDFGSRSNLKKHKCLMTNGSTISHSQEDSQSITNLICQTCGLDCGDQSILTTHLKRNQSCRKIYSDPEVDIIVKEGKDCVKKKLKLESEIDLEQRDNTEVKVGKTEQTSVANETEMEIMTNITKKEELNFEILDEKRANRNDEDIELKILPENKLPSTSNDVPRIEDGEGISNRNKTSDIVSWSGSASVENKVLECVLCKGTFSSHRDHFHHMCEHVPANILTVAGLTPDQGWCPYCPGPVLLLTADWHMVRLHPELVGANTETEFGAKGLRDCYVSLMPLKRSFVQAAMIGVKKDYSGEDDSHIHGGESETFPLR